MNCQLPRAVAVVVLALLFVGCDYGRSGRYRIVSWSAAQPSSTSAHTVSGSNQEQIVSLLRSFLSEREFTELRPDYWSRDGADVSWDLAASGDVKLGVGAFGAKRWLQESERVELEIIRFLLAQPGIRVVPDDTPKTAPIE